MGPAGPNPGMPPLDPSMLMQLGGMLPPTQPQTFLTEEKVQQFAKDDKMLWAKRNERMLRHRRLFEMSKDPKNRLKPGQIAAVTNDAKAIVRKMASMIANHPPAITIPARDPQKTNEAERCADFLRFYREESEIRFGEGPNGSRAYTEAERLVRDGMLVEITTIDGYEHDWPWYSCLPDPITVFPVYAGDERIRTTIIYRSNFAEIRQLAKTFDISLEEQYPDWRDRKDWDRAEITKCFAQNPDTGDWEMGILADSKLLYAGSIGYDPITITYAAGRNYDLTVDSTSDGSERWEHVGVGIYDLIEEPLKQKNADYSMLREMMAREANPIKIIFTDDENKLAEMTFEPGSNIHLFSEDKFQLASMNPDFNKFTAALQVAQQGIDRGSIPASLYGEAQGNTGVQEYMVLGNARDQVFVYVKAMQRYYSAQYRKVLTLYRDHGMAPVEFSAVDQNGIMLAGRPFSVEDVQALGKIQVKVEYSEVTPQNEAARAQMAIGLTRDKILDLEDARRLLPSPFNENPMLIGQKVLQDISLMNPMMTQILSLSAALLAPDPLVRSIAQAMLPAIMGQLEQQYMGPGGGTNTPGGPGGPPGNNKQMAPSANPAEMGKQAGQPEGQPAAGPAGSDHPSQVGAQ